MGLLQKLVVTPQSAELECRSFICGGKPRWVNVIARSEWDEQAKRVTGIVGAVKDISERSMPMRPLPPRGNAWRSPCAAIGDGVITTDITGNIVLMNSVAEDLTGWRQVDAQGQPLATAVFHSCCDHRQPCESPVARVLSPAKWSTWPIPRS